MSVQFLTANGYHSYPQLHQDVSNIKSSVQKVDDFDTKVEKSVFGSLPPVRRIMSLPDKLENGETTAAIGLAGLAVINLPEDISDIKSAYNQVDAKLKGQKFAAKYNYKELQHPFSFFRGTMLHDFVDPNTAKNKKLAKNLLKMDKTFAETTFGQKILKFLGVEQTGIVKTDIKNIGHNEQAASHVYAQAYKGSAFGKLTARAMNRTTKLGVIALSALELPKIFKSMTNPEESVGDEFKQVGKSGINVATTMAGVAYGGAIGSKHFGPVGSLIGMGIGAVAGVTGSKSLQDLVF